MPYAILSYISTYATLPYIKYKSNWKLVSVGPKQLYDFGPYNLIVYYRILLLKISSK